MRIEGHIVFRPQHYRFGSIHMFSIIMIFFFQRYFMRYLIPLQTLKKDGLTILYLFTKIFIYYSHHVECTTFCNVYVNKICFSFSCNILLVPYHIFAR